MIKLANEELLKFDDREVRKKFIETVESGIYFGTNVEGEDVQVLVDRGKGMAVKTNHKEKPLWWEVVEYDSEGFQESVSYRHV